MKIQQIAKLIRLPDEKWERTITDDNPHGQKIDIAEGQPCSLCQEDSLPGKPITVFFPCAHTICEECRRKLGESKMKAYKFSIAASEIALQSLKQEYLMGTKTISDYLIEEERFLNLKVDYSNATKEYFVSYFKIKSLEGNLLKVFDEFLPELN